MNTISNPGGAVKYYAARIDELTEVDYGDFKRKVGQYLLRVEELVAARNRGEPLAIIQNLKNKLVYVPQYDVEEAKLYIAGELKRLQGLL